MIDVGKNQKWELHDNMSDKALSFSQCAQKGE